ncbi:hypothetical protein HZA97_06945 [Candidatus Woesearchaeota archaeon]|nr:hypothetical protein [Candidatus Woesearchaeota archaeon]
MKVHALFLVLLVIGSLGVLVVSNVNSFSSTTGFQIVDQEPISNLPNLALVECPILVREVVKNE